MNLPLLFRDYWSAHNALVKTIEQLRREYYCIK